VEKGERVDALLLFKTECDVERVFFCGFLGSKRMVASSSASSSST
jgi:hypothetical protein